MPEALHRAPAFSAMPQAARSCPGKNSACAVLQLQFNTRESGAAEEERAVVPHAFAERGRGGSPELGAPPVIQVFAAIGLPGSPVHLNRTRMLRRVGDAFLRTFELPLLRCHDAMDGAFFGFTHEGVTFDQD